jgi:putative isomerase
MSLRILLLSLFGPLTFGSGVRSVYEPQVNPASFSFVNATTEPSLSFAWSSSNRPFPGPFGALWTATLSPPASVPIYFAASFGSSVGSFFKLWVDDHFLINAQSNLMNETVIGYYPLELQPSGSSIRVEYGVIGDNPSAELLYSQSQTGPWTIIPSALLTPSLSPSEDTYQNTRSVEERGWNSWQASDMLSSVLLPSGISMSLSFFDSKSRDTTANVNFACTGVRAGLHSARGNYTEIEMLELNGGAASVKVETALTTDGDLVIVLTTLAGSARPQDVVVSVHGGNMLPFSACVVNASISALSVTCAGTQTVVLQPVPPCTVNISSTTLTLALPAVGSSAAFSTALTPIPLPDALIMVAAQRTELLSLFAPYGTANGMNETFAGLFTAVAWTMIYSHTQGVVSGEFGRSEKIYEWDTLMTGAIAAHVDRWVAYNNIIRIVKGAVPAGFFPGFIQDEFGEVDNAKPQVGALALQDVFARFKEAWVVELTIDALAKYNKWWVDARMVEGIVAPGSYLDPELSKIERATHNNLQAAKFETGLDNSPLYDLATYNATSGLMSQWDVGMHALLIADANAIISLANTVGRSDLVPALTARATTATVRMETELWCEDAGAYLNKDYVTGAWVNTTGPPNAYPFLTGAPTAARVTTFLARYYFNRSEWCGNPVDCEFGLPSISRSNPAFQDQNYWRGRVWGPMNWIVYKGLKMYAGTTDAAVLALAAQSNNTFLGQWKKNHHVMENYDANDGSGCETSQKANPFYNWGALHALVAVEEMQLQLNK